MRKLVNVVEVENEGLIALLGERITLFCMNYFYTGVLAGVNDDCILLTNPAIVYETNPPTQPTWKDAQKLPNQVYVMKHAIEAFGVVK